MDKRGEYQEFPSNIFYLTVPKNFVGEALSASQISSNENVWIRGGGVSRVSAERFCLTEPKQFIGEHFGVSDKFFYRKFSCIGRGDITVLSELFVSQDRTENFCTGTLLFSGKLQVSKKNVDKRGHITIFSRSFNVSHCRKLSYGILLFSRKFLVSEKYMDEKGGITFFRQNFLVS